MIAHTDWQLDELSFSSHAAKYDVAAAYRVLSVSSVP
jgi:hypothetical protein